MAAGQAVGNYQLIKKLATGGMAEVWLANQIGIEGFNRHIVVKRILPHLSEDPEFVQMFLNEAKIASRFNHPNIAQIYDLGQGDGQYFIAMEFIHGEDLGRLMRKAWSTGQWIARPLAIRIIAEACKGLYYAHTRNDERGQPLRVVHRDISPQNILISFDGSVKLVDFGIAKAADQASMTKSGAIKGKFAYMAPEQAGGKPLDARTDLFALGLVLYELLTGVRPLKRDSELATLQAALECAIDPPSVVAEVPAELDDVVMRALAKAPDDRYRDASMFQMALEEFLISQRLVATSVQISELMETLFAERRAEEQRLGSPNPSVQGESQQGLPAMPEMPAKPKKQSRLQPPPREESEPEFTGTNPAKPGEAGGRNGDPEPMPEWEAPPAQAPVGPSRKYSNPNQTSHQRAYPSGSSGGGSPDVTRQKPATREFEGYEEPQEQSSSGRKSRAGLKRPPTQNGTNGHARVVQDDDDPEPPTEMPAPRRTSSSAGKLPRRTATGEMPEAPPRRSRDGLDPVEESASKKKKKATPAPAKAKQDSAELDRASNDLESLKRKQAQRRGGVIVLLLIVSIGALVAIFKINGGGANNITPNCVPIRLTVDSNPPTRVIVKRGGSLSQQPLDLGLTPVENVKGACVTDAILLMSEQLCISYEESIQFGQPDELRKIEKTFQETDVEISTKPAIKGLGVFCNGHKIGNTGMLIKMYEGPHHIELRDEKLHFAVPYDVNLIAKQGKYVNKPPAIELGDALRK
ncbi:MAG: protein kinase [Myxococcaceae bacterium]|nr:protein kinase [Myxococcaceae bacterium]